MKINDHIKSRRHIWHFITRHDMRNMHMCALTNTSVLRNFTFPKESDQSQADERKIVEHKHIIIYVVN